MALVTVQRSPSMAGSPHCSNSDGEAEDEEGNPKEKSECYFAGKGTAVVLALKDIPQYTERRLSTDSTRSTNSTLSNNSDIQLHLQSMFYLLQREDTLKMAVKLESQRSNRTRYLVIASRSCCRPVTSERRTKVMRHNSVKSSTTTSGALLNAVPSKQRQLSVDGRTHQQHQHQQPSPEEIRGDLITNITTNTTTTRDHRQSLKCDADKENASGDSKTNTRMEESCLLGIDCNERTTIGLVVPILADTTIHLDGDGGFSVAVYEKTHIFKPVSVQAMWSALQTLHKVSEKARENNFYPSGPSHDWLSSYESRIESDQSCLNEWNAMDALESRRPPSPDAIRNKPTAKEETKGVIKMKLKEIMMSVDLDEVTSKYIRGRLEEILDMDLGEYKSFIDEEMLLILGQMDAPTKIFEHVYLGSEWNASNLEELQKNGVRHILNVTREIDNFFPGTFEYFNVRVYDDEKTNLLKHWDDTYRYITRAKAAGSKVLVHCKMGVSRSASVVIAYAMKAYKWEFQRALDHVKERRSCIKPNKNFLNQLETYSGMLDAMKNKEKLQRSKSETNLKSTKDARLLPGSEPTPLIQALNQAKSKSSGEAGVTVACDDDYEPASVDGTTTTSSSSSGVGVRSTHRRSSAQKHHRRMARRSSSTSPKTQTAVVKKQQSQSMENLTPERSVAEEPKNMRFPGSNGENYSVTQNQVLHIQKHTPMSVRTRVNDLEAYQEPRRSPNTPFQRLSSGGDGTRNTQAPSTSTTSTVNASVSASASTVWTSSSKLITQTSNLDGALVVATTTTTTNRTRRDSSSSSDVFSTRVDNVFDNEERDKRQRRKTHSWTESFGPSGGIILDVTPSQPSQIPGSAILRTRGTTTATTTTRHRELPSRHSSWGSGDNRNSMNLRLSSSGQYDSNRNTTAIYEGEIQDLKRSTTASSDICPPPTTAISNSINSNSNNDPSSHLGTVKRTKQKLEENTGLKKRCQETMDAEMAAKTKHSPHLCRSASSATSSPRNRHPLRCSSEEQMHTSDIENKNTTTTTTAGAAADIEGVVLLRTHGPAVIAVDDQRISGNVQILKQNFEAKAVVVGGVTSASSIATNAATTSTTATTVNTFTSTTTITTTTTTSTNVPATAAAVGTTTATTTTTTTMTMTKKSHQSLPSSPVAQHVGVDNVQASSCGGGGGGIVVTTNHSLNASSPCSSTSNSASDSSVSESCDRNVRGLVHKYQTTSNSNCCPSGSGTTNPQQQQPPLTQTSSSSSSSTSSSATAIASSSTSFKPRPRSYYDRSLSSSAAATTTTTGTVGNKPHDYSDSRPPPAPVRYSNLAINSQQHQQASQNMTATDQQQQHQQVQHRRLVQHGKTHPLTRLSLPKQSFNTAAYNTM